MYIYITSVYMHTYKRIRTYIYIYLCVYRVYVFIYIYIYIYIIYVYISFMQAYSVMLHTYKLNWCYKYGHCEILELKLKARQKF